MKKHFVKVDSRNRVSLTKVTKDLPEIFRAYIEGDKIILEPIREVPDDEKWLFQEKNKKILEKVKEGLQETGSIDLGSFKEYLDD